MTKILHFLIIKDQFDLPIFKKKQFPQMIFVTKQTDIFKNRKRKKINGETKKRKKMKFVSFLKKIQTNKK